MKEKNRKRARSGVWSLLERMLQGVWRYRLLCLLLIIAAMVTTSALMHPGKMQSATALIALNYEEATRGLYPNQTRFNISLLKSDEVLSRALEKAGVTNMEPLALAEHISVSASSVGGMSIDSGSASAYKIATTYTVSYKRNEELPASISTGDMLQLIIEAYKEAFYENYTYVDTALNPNWDELDELFQEHQAKNWNLPDLVSVDLVPVNGGLSRFFSLSRQFFGNVAEQVLQQQAPQLV